MVEEFKPLVYKGILYDSYYVSSKGYIMSKRFDRPLAEQSCKGVISTSIFVDGHQMSITISRAVAETFIPNPDNLKYVNNINGNKRDNSVENLVWSKHLNFYTGTPEHVENSRLQRKKAVISARQKLKQMAIEYKGGKCIICGYSRCANALDFHHLDPTEKDFSIGGKTIAWEKLKAELDKCVLVCANCHREIGAGLIDINNYILR